MAKHVYPRIWVKAAPSPDPALAGKEVVRMPWHKIKRITSEPVELEQTPAVIRMLHLGDIVEVEMKEEPAPRKTRTKPVEAEAPVEKE